jgi:uncharacterized protein YdaU (DUF1376 family)
MPALDAIWHNADLKAKYDQLVAAGKEKKVAITAVMRKLFVLANALLRDHRKWVEKRLDQDGYSSRNSRTSLRRRSFSFLTSSCGPDIKSSCSLSGHCYVFHPG